VHDGYTRLVSGALFPLQERLKGHTTVAVRRSMEHTQWLHRDALDGLRVERLRSLLVHAGRHVPYYARVFDEAGFDPGKVESLEALRQLPFLTKATIRAHGEALKSSAANGLVRLNTGGSSGEPLIFFVGRERISHDVAAKWRATRWWDVDIGDREMVVWGSPIEVGAQDMLRGLRDRMLRTRLLPAFEMSEPRLDGFVAAIRRCEPRMLFGYPSALTYIAQHAERRGVALDNLGIRVAFVTAERLYDSQRTAIERVFGCRVANGYGSRDAGFIAHECPRGRLHVTAEDVIVELIDKDGTPVPHGVPGEIVVTHLATRDFPFIRYRTGDVAVGDASPCPCGRGLPVLKEIQGRNTDFIVAADGTVMHGLALIYVIRDLPGVESFKIVQESLHRTTVLLVVGASFDRATCEKIVAGFKRRLGQEVEVNVELVPHIAPESSGKHRYVVSRAGEAH
jgi:phenylacetate-CoA ligase